MSTVEIRTVAPDEAELRLDRWFKRHFPTLGHARLQKLVRTGQVRVDGRRARGDQRLDAGQAIRVPPLAEAGSAPEAAPVGKVDAAFMRGLVLHEDEAVLVLNKPAGLAVQGGSGTTRHLDRLLPALARGGERPRLVHRLDRDTTGVLVVGRTAAAAAALARAFRRHEVDKLYWAVVHGRPAEPAGRIDAAIKKLPGAAGERVEIDRAGQPARTRFQTIARAGRVASWLALQPETGRTHQLRVHCVALGSPVLGDRKYGGEATLLAGAPEGLMLHAREIRLPHPDGGALEIAAPLPPAMREAFTFLGFEAERGLPGTTLATFEVA